MTKYVFKLPTLHKLQQEVVDNTARFKVVVCGRRWGKTKMCSVIAVQKLLEGKRVWWLSPDYNTDEVGWREVYGLVSQLPLEIKIKNSFPKKISIENGGTIEFRSSTSFGRGEGLDYLIVDEADFIDGDGKQGAQNSGKMWNEVLRPSLMDRKGSAIFITTPNVENGWIHKLLVLGQSKNEMGVKSWKFDSYSNPFLDPKEIDDMKVDMPSLTFRREILAEYVSNTGARVQREWLIDRYLDDISANLLSKLYVSMGVDLAVSEKSTADYVAYAVLGRDKSGNIYVLDVKRMRGSFDQQIKFIKQAMDRWNPNTVGVESVGYQPVFIQQLSRDTNYAIFPVKVTRDKVTRFAPLEARYERHEVYHLRSLPPEFEDELFAFPNGQHDDQVDAMSCAWAVLGKPIDQDGDIPGIFTTSSIDVEDLSIDEVIKSDYGDILNEL